MNKLLKSTLVIAVIGAATIMHSAISDSTPTDISNKISADISNPAITADATSKDINVALITQTSDNQTAIINQTGIGNLASIIQSSIARNIAIITQTGNNNKASITQH